MKLSLLREEWAKRGLFQTTTPAPDPPKVTVMGPDPIRVDTTMGGRAPSMGGPSLFGPQGMVARPIATSFQCDENNHDDCTVPWCECRCHDADCWGGGCWGGQG